MVHTKDIRCMPVHVKQIWTTWTKSHPGQWSVTNLGHIHQIRTGLVVVSLHLGPLSHTIIRTLSGLSHINQTTGDPAVACHHASSPTVPSVCHNGCVYPERMDWEQQTQNSLRYKLILFTVMRWYLLCTVGTSGKPWKRWGDVRSCAEQLDNAGCRYFTGRM